MWYALRVISLSLRHANSNKTKHVFSAGRHWWSAARWTENEEVPEPPFSLWGATPQAVEAWLSTPGDTAQPTTPVDGTQLGTLQRSQQKSHHRGHTVDAGWLQSPPIAMRGSAVALAHPYALPGRKAPQTTRQANKFTASWGHVIGTGETRIHTHTRTHTQWLMAAGRYHNVHDPSHNKLQCPRYFRRLPPELSGKNAPAKWG